MWIYFEMLADQDSGGALTRVDQQHRRAHSAAQLPVRVQCSYVAGPGASDVEALQPPRR